MTTTTTTTTTRRRAILAIAEDATRVLALGTIWCAGMLALLAGLGL